MITVETIFHDAVGKTVRGIERMSDAGAEWTRIEFTDGSRIEIDEAEGEAMSKRQGNPPPWEVGAVRPPPPPNPPPPATSTSCFICQRPEAAEAKDARKVAVPTVNIVYEAIADIDSKDDFVKKNAKVRAWARDIIHGRFKRLKERSNV